MRGRQCFRCGSSQHLADRYSRVHSTCSYCGKPRHLAKACFKKMKDGGNSTKPQVTATPTPVGETEDTDCPCTVHYLVNLQIHCLIKDYSYNIRDTKVSMEVNTGSSPLLNSNVFSS